MIVLYIVLAFVVGAALGYAVRRYMARGRLSAAEREAERLQKEARREADTIIKEARLEAKEELHRVRTDVEAELRDRRAELSKTEQRIVQREEQADVRALELDRREQSVRDHEAQIVSTQEQLQAMRSEQTAMLERISGLTVGQARDMLLNQTEAEVRHEMAKMVRSVEEEARREADRRARNILALSIQRTAANHVAETTVSVVALPSDDMKGRIIGREGRNIRALESMTGIDFIIDDTPEAVVLSGFDGVRREIARLTLQKLIVDGRIHPARIEEMYQQAQAEIEAVIEEAGEQACFDTNIHGLAPELVRTLGRLKFRTSYGQNVLTHSIEVAHLAGIMAAELGANPKIARRAGLLHDIGKAIDHEVDGSHAQISEQLARSTANHRASATRSPRITPMWSRRP
jgi:ribonucrease Y